jgi:hypothetical protein
LGEEYVEIVVGISGMCLISPNTFKIMSEEMTPEVAPSLANDVSSCLLGKAVWKRVYVVQREELCTDGWKGWKARMG